MPDSAAFGKIHANREDSPPVRPGATTMHVDIATQESAGAHALLTERLDHICNALGRGGSISLMLPAVVEHARHAVAQAGDEIQLAALRQTARAHPVAGYLYQCPFTAHSARKPRGYAGDAELIDYIYCHRDRTRDVRRSTAIGRRILCANVDRPAPLAVRARRQIVADVLSQVAMRVRSARILSVACGHARELELIDDALLSRVATFVGLDQDAKSLEVAAGYRIGDRCVETQRASIIDLLKDGQLDGFDLIYSSGLYDYLSDRLCQRLTHNLFNRLRPGGTLLLANFLPGLPDAGYMELFMDWSLIYRTRSQIRDFAAAVDPARAADIDYFTDTHQQIGFLKVVKR